MVTEIKLSKFSKLMHSHSMHECAKAITFLLTNDRVLPQSLMVYFGTECIDYCTHFSSYFPMHGNFGFILWTDRHKLFYPTQEVVKNLITQPISTMAEKGHDCKHSPFFFTTTLVVYFPSKLHSPFFLQNYTRRFFNAIITRDVFSKNYTRRFFRVTF